MNQDVHDQWQMARDDWWNNRDLVLAHNGPKVSELALATDSFFASPWPKHAASEGWRPVYAFGLSPDILSGWVRYASDAEVFAEPGAIDLGVVAIIGSGAANAIVNIDGTIATLLASVAYARGGPSQFQIDTRRGNWTDTPMWWKLPAYRSDEGGRPRQRAPFIN